MNVEVFSIQREEAKEVNLFGNKIFCIFYLVSSVADPGCLSLDPNFFFVLDPGSRVKKIPDPGSVSQNLSFFNPKIWF